MREKLLVLTSFAFWAAVAPSLVSAGAVACLGPSAPPGLDVSLYLPVHGVYSAAFFPGVESPCGVAPVFVSDTLPCPQSALPSPGGYYAPSAMSGAYCGMAVPPHGSTTCEWFPYPYPLLTPTSFLTVGFDVYRPVLVGPPMADGNVASIQGEWVFDPIPSYSPTVFTNPHPYPARIIAYPTAVVGGPTFDLGGTLDNVNYVGCI